MCIISRVNWVPTCTPTELHKKGIRQRTCTCLLPCGTCVQQHLQLAAGVACNQQMRPTL
jgi:hypothetical protein